MSFWRSWFGGRITAPRWSGFTDADAFARWATSVVELLAAHDVAADRALVRTGSVIITNGDGRELEWMLQELACACANCDEAEWRALIADSYTRRGGGDVEEPRAGELGESRYGYDLDDEDGDDVAIDSDGSDGDDADQPAWMTNERLANIRVQLFRAEHLAVANAIARPVAPGLVAVIVEDVFGALELTVTRENARRLECDDDGLFLRGRANAVRSDAAGIVIEPGRRDGGDFEIAVSNGFYLGACLLDLIARVPGERGHIVCMLSWHHWVMAPVTATTTKTWCASLAEVVAELDTRVTVTPAERLSTALFWYRGDAGFAPIAELLPSLAK